MLPAKVTTGARKLLLTRVQRLVRLLKHRATPDPMLAMDAWLVGEAGWLLDPAFLASHEQRRQETAARKAFGVCMWEPECAEPAFTPDGFCKGHARKAETFLRDLFADRKPSAKAKTKRARRRR